MTAPKRRRPQPGEKWLVALDAPRHDRLAYATVISSRLLVAPFTLNGAQWETRFTLVSARLEDGRMVELAIERFLRAVR